MQDESDAITFNLLIGINILAIYVSVLNYKLLKVY